MRVLSFKEVEQFKQEYNYVPIGKELYSDITTPISILRRLAEKDPNYFLLESVENGNRVGRYSFLGYQPVKRIYCMNTGIVVKENEKELKKEGDPLLLLKHEVSKYRSPRLKEVPTFTGGFIGYFAYEMIALAEKTLTVKESEFPKFDLSLYDKVIVFDHLLEKIYVIANVKLEDGEAAYEKALQAIDTMIEMIYDQTPLKKIEVVEKVEFQCNMTEQQYCNVVEQTKAYIREGDIFQAVLSRRFEAYYPYSLLNTYRVMRTINPSPYMYYMKCGDMEIAGVSPETLIKLVEGKLTTFPVAGTRPRGKTVNEDQRLEEELLKDKKELAEHNMLVDLARNDIGRLSRFGTVTVEEYKKIHRFSKVMHIASIVTGRIKDSKDRIDTVATMLPAGTLSGAPKIRACEIIDQLEPCARGVYGGAIGYIDLSGNLDVCIGIRTAVKKNDKVYVQAGGGIVADSIPKKEYEESYNKAKAVLEAIERASEVNGL